MKKSILFILFFFCVMSNNLFAQVVSTQSKFRDKPEYFIPKNHNSDFLRLRKAPAKSFYESKSDWQHIIDSTWGPGDPLSKKLLIFNAYAKQVHDKFDGFNSLKLNWDSLYNFYLNKINDSTSMGAFSSIMSHFAYDLKDMHTRAYDSTVVLTPLNPGVPILLLGSYLSVEHFGAVTTILPDSNTLVLRVVPNHPLNLEPGDIILGYEGIPWKNLIRELLDAGLPMIAMSGGCKTADTYLNLFGAGLNWHLFNTIDILKHSTGETQHLSVLPLLNLNVPPMVNNEQLPILNIPFPNVLSDSQTAPEVQCATYGIMENTNIGYIYLAEEDPEVTADNEFFSAINSLKNADALIIDMRLNYGGWALFDNAFDILFNEFHKTVEDAYRCNTSTFNLCPNSDWNLFQINGAPPTYYDRPIAVLLGPTCVSCGDVTAQRLRYHPMVRFFGESSDASLGDNLFIENFPGWYLRNSISDMFHSNNVVDYLNRREFPIDFPVWFNQDDVALGKDAVVEKALEWINTLTYAHNVAVDRYYFPPGQGNVNITASLTNPLHHSAVLSAIVTDSAGTLRDSVLLYDDGMHGDGNAGDSLWGCKINVPSDENMFNISIRTNDITDTTFRRLPNVASFTTEGPVVLDSISYLQGVVPGRHLIKPFVHNLGTVKTIIKPSVRVICNDPWISSINSYFFILPNITPNSSVATSNWINIIVIDSLFPGYFNLRVEVAVDGWTYWVDSTRYIITGIEDSEQLPSAFNLSQNYPNPFNPTTTINYSVPKSSLVTIKVYDVLGREIETLVNEEKPTGTYELTWDASRFPSGVYFYRMRAGNYSSVKKMILLK